jgi:hypothetical protein
VQRLLATRSVARAIRSARSPTSISEFYRQFDVFKFATTLDALLDLQESTAKALAAMFDQRIEAMMLWRAMRNRSGTLG